MAKTEENFYALGAIESLIGTTVPKEWAWVAWVLDFASKYELSRKSHNIYFVNLFGEGDCFLTNFQALIGGHLEKRCFELPIYSCLQFIAVLKSGSPDVSLYLIFLGSRKDKNYFDEIALEYRPEAKFS